MDAVAREVVRINDTGLLRSGARIDAQRSIKVGHLLCDIPLVRHPRFAGFPLAAGIVADLVPARQALKNGSNQHPGMKLLHFGGM